MKNKAKLEQGKNVAWQYVTEMPCFDRKGVCFFVATRIMLCLVHHKKSTMAWEVVFMMN